MLKLDTDDKLGHTELWLRLWVSCLSRGNHSNDFLSSLSHWEKK